MSSIFQHDQHHNVDNDDFETLVRLERSADEPLALRSLLLWPGWSCVEDHRHRGRRDDYDCDDDGDDDDCDDDDDDNDDDDDDDDQ